MLYDFLNYTTTAFNFLGNASRENPFDTEKKVKSPVVYTAGLQTSFSLSDISGTIFTCANFQNFQKYLAQCKSQGPGIC